MGLADRIYEEDLREQAKRKKVVATTVVNAPPPLQGDYAFTSSALLSKTDFGGVIGILESQDPFLIAPYWVWGIIAITLAILVLMFT